jgi:ATP-binding cassette subfamily F protein 3
MHPGEARSYLAQYLFRGEDVYKPLDALSGGERARLALAILALEGVNFLVLDEPTNHLDIPAQESLQAVLEDFPGTVLLVSHDRYLIDRLATQIWEIRARRLVVFTGTYREYILRAIASPVKNGSKGISTRHAPPLHKPLLRADSYEARKRIEALDRLESRIHEQEAAIQTLSHKLQNTSAPQNYEAVSQVSWQLAQAQVELDKLMSEWEKLAAV